MMEEKHENERGKKRFGVLCVIFRKRRDMEREKGRSALNDTLLSTYEDEGKYFLFGILC